MVAEQAHKHTMTSREFNRDVAGAKRAAKDGPVVVTDRGKPSHVLLSYEEYRRLVPKMSLRDSIYDPKSAHIDLPLLDRSRDSEFRDIDLSD